MSGGWSGPGRSAAALLAAAARRVTHAAASCSASSEARSSGQPLQRHGLQLWQQRHFGSAGNEYREAGTQQLHQRGISASAAAAAEALPHEAEEACEAHGPASHLATTAAAEVEHQVLHHGMQMSLNTVRLYSEHGVLHSSCFHSAVVEVRHEPACIGHCRQGRHIAHW